MKEKFVIVRIKDGKFLTKILGSKNNISENALYWLQKELDSEVLRSESEDKLQHILNYMNYDESEPKFEIKKIKIKEKIIGIMELDNEEKEIC